MAHAGPERVQAVTNRKRLAPETVIAIRDARLAGATYPQLAAQFGRGERAVLFICKGRSYGHLPASDAVPFRRPSPVPPISDVASVAARLEAKTRKAGPDECWEWTGAFCGSGYGNIGVDNRSRSAHRVTYEVIHGPIPAGMEVMHSCDNRRCCNPAHLSLGTTAENAADKVAKGRQPSPKSRKAA